MVGFSVTSVFVKHVRGACLDLGVNDCLPELSGFDGLSSFAFFFKFGIFGFELFSPDIGEAWTFIWAHQSPVQVIDNSFHE